MGPKNIAAMGVAAAVAAAVAASVVFGGGGGSGPADAGVDASVDAGRAARAPLSPADCAPPAVFNGRDCEEP